MSSTPVAANRKLPKNSGSIYSSPRTVLVRAANSSSSKPPDFLPIDAFRPTLPKLHYIAPCSPRSTIAPLFVRLTDRLVPARPHPTQVDLRSAKELERDEFLHGDMYKGFVNVAGVDGRAGAWGGGGVWDEGAVQDENSSGAAVAVGGAAGGGKGLRRRRYFVSLIDESIYRKGVFQRLRRRHKVSAGGGWG